MRSPPAPPAPETRNGREDAHVSAGRRQGGHVAEMQRRRLLAALLEVVADQGLEGASVGGVCRRAGVSRRTFYESFMDSEACLLAAFEEAIERIEEGVRPVYDAPGGWSERVRAALTHILEQLDSEPGLARLCVIESSRAGSAVTAKRRRLLDALAAVVDEGRCESRSGDSLSPLTAPGIVGGALAAVHARLLEPDHGPLVELVGPLMGMIVHPYLGPAAARRELQRPVPAPRRASTAAVRDPFKDLRIRFTYRTALVLATIATDPGASNRLIADTAGIADEGQTSRLLRRLARAGLIENRGEGQPKGEPNAWALTERGLAVHAALGG